MNSTFFIMMTGICIHTIRHKYKWHRHNHNPTIIEPTSSANHFVSISIYFVFLLNIACGFVYCSHSQLAAHTHTHYQNSNLIHVNFDCFVYDFLMANRITLSSFFTRFGDDEKFLFFLFCLFVLWILCCLFNQDFVCHLFNLHSFLFFQRIIQILLYFDLLLFS